MLGDTHFEHASFLANNAANMLQLITLLLHGLQRDLLGFTSRTAPVKLRWVTWVLRRRYKSWRAIRRCRLGDWEVVADPLKAIKAQQGLRLPSRTNSISI